MMLPAILLTLTLVGAIGCTSSSEKAQIESAQLARAKTAYEAGDFAGSEQVLAGVLKDSPASVEALRTMALAQAAQGKNPEAIAQYAAVVALEPDDHPSWYRMALLERIMGKSKDAEAHLEKALSSKPGDSGYTDELARTKMSLGAYKEAATLWGDLLKDAALNKESRKEVLLLQGQAYQAANDYTLAEKTFGKALALDPADKALKDLVESFD